MHACRKFGSQAHKSDPILNGFCYLVFILILSRVTLILRPCEGQLELWQLGQLPVHVLVLADFLKGEVGLAQEDALPHDAAVLNTNLQICSVKALVGPLDKTEIKGNEVGINGY